MYVNRVIDISDVPQECIDDCGASGPVDEAVAFWLDVLQLTVHRGNAIRCLRSTGAWSEAELRDSTAEDLAARVLWLACCDFREYQTNIARGYRADNVPSGSDVFYLEG
jgi:hypothetical protein